MNFKEPNTFCKKKKKKQKYIIQFTTEMDGNEI